MKKRKRHLKEKKDIFFFQSEPINCVSKIKHFWVKEKLGAIIHGKFLLLFHTQEKLSLFRSCKIYLPGQKFRRPSHKNQTSRWRRDCEVDQKYSKGQKIKHWFFTVPYLHKTVYFFYERKINKKNEYIVWIQIFKEKGEELSK